MDFETIPLDNKKILCRATLEEFRNFKNKHVLQKMCLRTQKRYYKDVRYVSG